MFARLSQPFAEWGSQGENVLGQLWERKCFNSFKLQKLYGAFCCIRRHFHSLSNSDFEYFHPNLLIIFIFWIFQCSPFSHPSSTSYLLLFQSLSSSFLPFPLPCPLLPLPPPPPFSFPPLKALHCLQAAIPCFRNSAALITWHCTWHNSWDGIYKMIYDKWYFLNPPKNRNSPTMLCRGKKMFSFKFSSKMAIPVKTVQPYCHKTCFIKIYLI